MSILPTSRSTGKDIIEVHAASEKDVDQAVTAARTAFEGDWSTISATERGALLTRIAALVDRDRERNPTQLRVREV